MVHRFIVSAYDDLPRASTVGELALSRVNARFEMNPEQILVDGKPVVLNGRPLKTLHRPHNAHPDLTVLKLHDVVYLPRRTFLDHKLMRTPAISFRRQNLAPEFIESPPLEEGIPQIDELVYSIDTSNSGHGHVLLEMVSQLWAVKDANPQTLLAHPKVAQRYKALIGLFSPCRIVSPLTPVKLRQVLIVTPSFLLDRSVTQRFLQDVRYIRSSIARSSIARSFESDILLYVSRRGIAKRSLVNETDVESEFQRQGFQSISPETLSLGDQVELFSRARVVAGPVGSAMYNTIFCQPGTQRLVIAPEEFTTRNDSLITAATGKSPYFVFGRSSAQEKRRAMLAPWSVDVADVRRGIDHVLRGTGVILQKQSR
jgi:hypothetical protein